MSEKRKLITPPCSVADVFRTLSGGYHTCPALPTTGIATLFGKGKTVVGPCYVCPVLRGSRGLLDPSCWTLGPFSLDS